MTNTPVPSYDEVGACLRRLGYYRVRRAQIVANQGAPDGISGATLLGLGLRETRERNINGGARWDKTLQRWVPTKDDKGIFQISGVHHMVELRGMPGVEEGTWAPVVEGATALDDGYCPRYEESLQLTLLLMHENQAAGHDDYGISVEELGRFAVVAHNAGLGGAARGYREGNPDKYTTFGDYSEWVFEARTLINKWLNKHRTWKA